MGGSTAVLALVLLIVGSTTDGGGERGVRRRGAGALPPPALVRDGEIVVTFPIADGLQPGDFPTRRYQELLAGSGLAQPDAAAPGSGGAEERSAKSERSGTPDEPRESASGPSLRALMREWGQINWLESPGQSEVATIVAEMLTGNKHVAIVTTASLPWLTGTAVNPLLRAAYLAKRGARVTLLVPWLHPSDQRLVFPANVTFGSPSEQEAWIRRWLQDRAQLPPELLGDRLAIRWYASRYHPEKGSVLALGDLTKYLTREEQGGVCVLEEPEHLNWFHNGEHWCQKWQLVIGIIHTNYWSYARSHETGGLMAAALTQQINRWMCGGYCHKSIKLSDALPPLPRSVTQNTHGVRQDFIAIGQRLAQALRERSDALGGVADARARTAADASTGAARDGALPPPPPPFSRSVYFLGKCLWAKGHRELLDLLGAFAEQIAAQPGNDARAAGADATGADGGGARGGGARGGGAHCPIEVDVFGSGPDRAAIGAEAARLCDRSGGSVRVRLFAGIDHASEEVQAYKIFVNPCRSDVLCTTTAEALAAGKFAIIEDNPSNAFFKKCANALFYSTAAQFCAQLEYALSAMPKPLLPSQAYLLSWEAATDRLIDAMLTPVAGEEGLNPGDKAFAAFHQSLFRGRFGDWSRGVLGAGPIARQFELRREHEKGDGGVESAAADVLVEASVRAREAAVAADAARGAPKGERAAGARARSAHALAPPWARALAPSGAARLPLARARGALSSAVREAEDLPAHAAQSAKPSDAGGNDGDGSCTT
ncbi:hypothetical protein KFE25_012013 [Diacronema lutheri]|uniref:Digalactosyldiacylglycerol synthase n=2 Tax=Diacronema lutheri TaxID=2081491 RepID=A0A8J5X7V2_DIALT|nr:hypothetical protein KFE25_012013 [Diacronema lutheri]